MTLVSGAEQGTAACDSLEVAEGLAVVPISEQLEGQKVDRVLNEPDRAVAKNGVYPVGMHAARRDNAISPVGGTTRTAVTTG